jgi:hypothetical protein
VHSTGEVAASYVTSAKAAAVSTAETGVSTAETAGMPATAGVTSATLCPEGNGEEKRERRDECQATHTRLL